LHAIALDLHRARRRQSPVLVTTTPVAAIPVTSTPATSTPETGPASDTVAATPVPGTQYGTVETPVIPLGRAQTATGHNFSPGALVQMTLEPGGIDLGTFPVGSDGTVTARFGTTSLNPGTYTVTWRTVP
jgi:hypothetical protein